VKQIGSVLLAACAYTAVAAPQMELGTLLSDGSKFLTVSTMSAPAVLDWNNDGQKDLLVGDSSGYVWLYVNRGTDASPQFNGGTRLTSGGSAIITDSGG